MNIRTLMTSTLLCSAAYAVLAQDTVSLGQITLSATGLETQVLDSPSSVTVLTAEEISARPRASVAQLLREVPGVIVIEDGGIERIRIRGESSRRVAIEIDGQQLTDHSGYGQPVLIDPASIERIEVIRGASSVVSGTQAIGGVVNIITKRGADRPFAGTVSTAYFGATDGYRNSASVGGAQGGFDWRLSLSKSDRGNRETPEGALDPSDIQDRSGSLHLGYSTGNHYVALKASAYDLSANVYVPSDPSYLNFSIELPKRDLRKAGLYYEGTDLVPWLSSLRADLYTQTIDREFHNELTTIAGPGMTVAVDSTSTDEQRTSGFNLRAELEPVSGQRTLLGFEYEDDRLDTDKNSLTVMTGFGPFPMTQNSVRHSEASVRTTSAFVQHEADLGPALTAIAGLRYYHVESELEKAIENGAALPTQSTTDDRWLGSFGLVYDLNENSRLRARISQGYTYPTLQQLFLTTTGGGVTISGNPDLKPETATTAEIGFRQDNGALLTDIAFFYTSSEDYIANVSTGPRSAEYRNINEARSWGIEMEAEYSAGDWTPYITATAMKREFTYANGRTTTDTGTPDLFGTVGLRRTWSGSGADAMLDVFLQGASEAKQRDSSGDVVSRGDGYATLNLRGSLEFDNGWQITGEALNLADRSYDPIDELPGAERSFNLLASYSF